MGPEQRHKAVLEQDTTVQLTHGLPFSGSGKGAGLLRSRSTVQYPAEPGLDVIIGPSQCGIQCPLHLSDGGDVRTTALPVAHSPDADAKLLFGERPHAETQRLP